MNERSHIRRCLVQGAMAAGLVGLAAAGIALSLPAEANYKADGAKQQQESAPHLVEDKVEASVYSRVMRLREDIALTNGDLAALGLTQAQAEDVLTRLVEWVEANQAALIQADNNVEAARRQLAELERRVRVGEADEQEARGLEDLYGSVAQSQTNCDLLCMQAGSHAIAPAPANVRGQWERASRYAYLPLEMRHLPGLDDARVNELLEVVSIQMAQPGASAGGGDLRAALPSSTNQSMNEVRSRVQTYLPGVRAAEREALPVPAELGEDDAGKVDQ